MAQVGGSGISARTTARILNRLDRWGAVVLPSLFPLEERGAAPPLRIQEGIQGKAVHTWASHHKTCLV